MTAQMIEAQVGDDAAQPRPDAAGAEFECAGMVPDADERLLHDVLSVALRLEHPPRDGQQAADMAVDQQAKGGAVAVTNSGENGCLLGYHSRVRSRPVARARTAFRRARHAKAPHGHIWVASVA